MGDIPYHKSETASRILEIKQEIDSYIRMRERVVGMPILDITPGETYYQLSPERENLANKIAWEWASNLPGKFKQYTKYYTHTTGNIWEISFTHYPAGKSIVTDELKVLGCLEITYVKPENTMGRYQELVECVKAVTSARPVLGEVLVKKTVPLLGEIGNDIGQYHNLCKELLQPG